MNSDHSTTQNDIRRAQKKKQKSGGGKHRKDVEVVEVHHPRQLNAVFAGDTAKLIADHMMEKPDVPVTSFFIRKLLKGGGVSFKVTDEQFPTMNGEEFKVTESGIATPLFVHTVRIWTAGGFGVEIKSLRDNRVIVN